MFTRSKAAFFALIGTLTASAALSATSPPAYFGGTLPSSATLPIGQTTGTPLIAGSGIGFSGTWPSITLSTTNTVATPLTTNTGDIPTYGGIDGRTLSDTGLAVGTSGGTICLNNASCTWSGYQTFTGGTNLSSTVGSMLINGDMDIDQRYEGASNGVGVDRWTYACGTCNGMALQRSTLAPLGYIHSLKVLAPAGPITISAGDVRVVEQKVEGSMVSPLAWGTANGQAATLAFQAYCSVTGTYAYSITNSTPNYSYVGTYTIGSANTWTPVSVSIPAPANGSPWSDVRRQQLRFDVAF